MLEHTGVWMLKSERTLKDFNVSAFDDIGTLKVENGNVYFDGSEQYVLSDIQKIEYGKYGRDFINHWIKIVYKDTNEEKNLYFADGKLLGWKGILGGTKSLYHSLLNLKSTA